MSHFGIHSPRSTARSLTGEMRSTKAIRSREYPSADSFHPARGGRPPQDNTKRPVRKFGQGAFFFFLPPRRYESTRKPL